MSTMLDKNDSMHKIYFESLPDNLKGFVLLMKSKDDNSSRTMSVGDNTSRFNKTKNWVKSATNRENIAILSITIVFSLVLTSITLSVFNLINFMLGIHGYDESWQWILAGLLVFSLFSVPVLSLIISHSPDMNTDRVQNYDANEPLTESFIQDFLQEEKDFKKILEAYENEGSENYLSLNMIYVEMVETYYHKVSQMHRDNFEISKFSRDLRLYNESVKSKSLADKYEIDTEHHVVSQYLNNEKLI